MFWEKCGKIISNDAGKLIDCDDCPCPYWGIFAFVSRSFNRDTGEINYCYQSVDVQLLPVVNGCLNYSYMYQRNIKVKRTPDENGKVGYVKNCIGCWEDCWEWDEEGNCIDEYEYCEDCSEIRVYRLSACFDSKKEALEQWYAECEVIPDGEGNYPDTDSYQFLDCLENVWRKKAEKYKINSTFTFQDKEWSRSFYGTFVQDCDYTVRCYNWETGQLVYQGADYPSSWGDGWDCWEQQSNCRDYVISGSNGQLWGYVDSAMDYSQEQLQGLVGEAISSLNSYIATQVSDYKNYNTTYDKRENTLCFNKSYASNYGYYDYSGWGNCCSSHKWWGVVKTKLQVENYDETRHPKGAKGFIIDYTIKRIVRNNENQTVTTESKIPGAFVPFGGEIDFPLADNLSRFYQCECYSDFTGFEAAYYPNERYEINFTVKDYKF